jgi:NAD(P)H-flavin reductase
VATLDEELTARVVEVKRLTPTIIEVIVRAPAAARHFHPGQFYRLQNFESGAVTAGIDGDQVKLVMEGIALTGAWVDRRAGLLSMIALELGVSSRLCAYLAPGQEVIVMGPTGAPTEIPTGENVLLAGGGLGNAVLFSIARALRDNGNRVIYFAGYRKGEDLFKREDIEAATDQVIWSTDAGAPIEPSRPQDAHFRGNIVDCLVAYATGALGRQLVPLQGVDRMIVIGSDRMMAAVKSARGAALAPYLKREHVAIASINSPMQCMLKEVCAQCLQKHVDPATGQETIIFSCFNQDQLMDRVDFFNLNARLRQNTVQEKLTNQWLEQVLARAGLAHA